MTPAPAAKAARPWEIPALLALCCGAMALLELNLSFSYPVRSAVKAALLLGPMALWCRLRRVPLGPIFRFASRRAALLSLGLGAGVYLLILGAWFLLRPFIDPAAIAAALGRNLQIQAGNFIWVALYISVCNSFVEETFFRGFGYLLLRRAVPDRWAAALSAGIFALYHTAMLRGWFSPALYLLALVGLFVGGLIFNRLNRPTGTIYPGWLTHLCANLAINTVGCMVLGIF